MRCAGSCLYLRSAKLSALAGVHSDLAGIPGRTTIASIEASPSATLPFAWRSVGRLFGSAWGVSGFAVHLIDSNPFRPNGRAPRKRANSAGKM